MALILHAPATFNGLKMEADWEPFHELKGTDFILAKSFKKEGKYGFVLGMGNQDFKSGEKMASIVIPSKAACDALGEALSKISAMYDMHEGAEAANKVRPTVL